MERIILIILIILILTSVLLWCYFRFKAEGGGGRLVIGGYFDFFDRYDVNEALHFFEEGARQNMLNIVLREHEDSVCVNDLRHKLPYSSSRFVARNVIHIGQFKLQLTEIELLTKYLEHNDQRIWFIYAGSAPCNHLSIIAELFPSIRFLLVDPNIHEIRFAGNKTHFDEPYDTEVVYFQVNKEEQRSQKVNFFDGKLHKRPIDQIDVTKYDWDSIVKFLKTSTFRYHIIEDFFTNELAKAISRYEFFRDHFFCSDIRTNGFKEDFPTDLDIVRNSAQQFNWANIMQPKVVMFKFVLPFFGKQAVRDWDSINADLQLAIKFGLDFRKDYEQHSFRFLAAEHIWLQAFPGYKSSETRFVTSREFSNNYTKLANYSYDDWEDRFFVYNNFTRMFMFHPENKVYFGSGIDSCADCNLAIRILEGYFQKFEQKIDPLRVKQLFLHSIDIIGRSLYEESHGYFLQPFADTPAVLAMQRNYTTFALFHVNESCITKLSRIATLDLNWDNVYTLYGRDRELSKLITQVIQNHDPTVYRLFSLFLQLVQTNIPAVKWLYPMLYFVSADEPRLENTKTRLYLVERFKHVIEKNNHPLNVSTKWTKSDTDDRVQFRNMDMVVSIPKLRYRAINRFINDTQLTQLLLANSFLMRAELWAVIDKKHIVELNGKLKHKRIVELANCALNSAMLTFDEAALKTVADQYRLKTYFPQMEQGFPVIGHVFSEEFPEDALVVVTADMFDPFYYYFFMSLWPKLREKKCSLAVFRKVGASSWIVEVLQAQAGFRFYSQKERIFNDFNGKTYSEKAALVVFSDRVIDE